MGSHIVLLKTSQIGAIGSHTELRLCSRQDIGTPARTGACQSSHQLMGTHLSYLRDLCAGLPVLMLKVQRPARRRQERKRNCPLDPTNCGWGTLREDVPIEAYLRGS